MVCAPGERADWRAEALASLAANGVTPRIVPATGNAAQSRRVALLARDPAADYVSWCDPDDTVPPGTLPALLDAMQREPGAGLYFTDEAYTNEAGQVIGEQPAARLATAQAIAAHPLNAHHLTVIRADLLPALLPVMARHASGGNWWLAAGAAHLGGCVRVPVIGYRWRIRPGSACHAPRCDTWTADEIGRALAAL